jgi:long-chain fatty acid transport protein
MARIRHVGALLGLLVWLPGVAHAAGFEFPDNGVQGLGRGGAFTAKADDLSAIVYNVAGLAKLKGTHLIADLSLASLNYSFARAGVYDDPGQPWDGQPFPRVRNHNAPMPLPVIAVSTDFGLRTFTFALGVYGPPSVGIRDFPAQVTVNGGAAPAPQRFDLINENVIVAYPTLAVAWRPLPWLYVGGAFQPTVAHLQEHVYAMSYALALIDPNVKCSTPDGAKIPEASPCALKAGLDLWDKFAPTGILSALARPVEHVELGLSARLPLSFDTSGDGSTESPPGVNVTVQNDPGPGATLKTNMPFVLRFGARYYFGPRDDERGDVELDAVYEGWSRITTFNATFNTNLGAIDASAPHHYQDAFSLRLGGAYNLRFGPDRLALRAGAYYESAATPNEWTRLDFDGFARVGATIGAGYKWRGLTFDLAFAYVWMPTRTVTNSQVIPIYALSDPPAQPTALNGTFESRMWIFGFGVSAAFDEVLERGQGLRD